MAMGTPEVPGIHFIASSGSIVVDMWIFTDLVLVGLTLDMFSLLVLFGSYTFQV